MRIVVTGMGVVSPLGVGVEHFWSRVCDGANGVRRITRFDTQGFACQVAAEVPSIEEDPYGFDPDQSLEPRAQKRMDRFIQFAIAATDEAFEQAGWVPKSDHEKERSGIIIGTGVGGFPAMTAATRLLDEKGPRRLSPFLVPSFLANLASGQISIRHGLKGPSGAPVTACAASLQAIGDAVRLMKNGEADVMVAGGAEACIDPVSVAGFSAAKAMSTQNNETPEFASRPFDQARDGFVIGEGAGVLVLETEEHALARGATPLAYVSGYGTTSDAFHVTAGSPDGEGGLRAMRRALAGAGLTASDIGYVNAHSTSTQVGDSSELAALNTLFDERGKDLAVSSSKSMFGHLLGAAGAVEAICCVKALTSGLLPPSRNLMDPDPLLTKFEFIPGKAIARKVDHVLTNGFGFGGVNASAVFSRA